MGHIFESKPALVTGAVVTVCLFFAWVFEIGSFAPTPEDLALEYAKKNGFKFIEHVSYLPVEQLNFKGVDIPTSGLKYSFEDRLSLVNLPPVCIAIAQDKYSARIWRHRKFKTSMELRTIPREKIGIIHIYRKNEAWNCRKY